MNYHQTNDHPINLETLVKLVRFANKVNTKRALINNFIKDEDYKVNIIPRDDIRTGVFIPRDENLGGRPEETIMLNIDTSTQVEQARIRFAHIFTYIFSIII